MNSSADFRSDTLTTPDEHMKAVMAAADVGDDVFEDDPTMKQLERRMSEMTGKEAALFVCSGTMGNLISSLIHGEGLFSEILLGDLSHVANFEVGGASVLGRIQMRTVATAPDGTLPLERLRERVQMDNLHNTITRCIFLENTHNVLGGKVLPTDYVHSVRALCDEKGIRLHCDAARIWNVSVALGKPLMELLAPFDTASICFSKGLGAPVGSAVVGNHEFITKARHVRKLLGGGMRQVGMLAAAAMDAIDRLLPRMHEDHENAKLMIELLRQHGIACLDADSNIVVFYLGSDAVRASVLSASVEAGVKLVPWLGEGGVRAVPHYGNTAKDVEHACSVIGDLYRKQQP